MESLLILELPKDGGGRKYLTLSVRGLYRHILDAITTAPDSLPEPASSSSNNKSPPREALVQNESEKADLGDASAVSRGSSAEVPGADFSLKIAQRETHDN